MVKKKKGYNVFLILTIVFTLAAISTLIPSPSASGECLIGYKAHCTYTPVSTAICLVLVAACCIIRKRGFTYEE
ncbi:hypothetical protein KAU45_07985 [bacterium]|nr:hypothetical protein [bacterium]